MKEYITSLCCLSGRQEKEYTNSFNTNRIYNIQEAFQESTYSWCKRGRYPLLNLPY